jgi:hypothetical protein
MLAFAVLPPPSVWSGALVDSALLSISSFLLFYLLAFRPINNYISELKQTKDQLRWTSPAGRSGAGVYAARQDHAWFFSANTVVSVLRPSSGLAVALFNLHKTLMDIRSIFSPIQATSRAR